MTSTGYRKIAAIGKKAVPEATTAKYDEKMATTILVKIPISPLSSHDVHPRYIVLVSSGGIQGRYIASRATIRGI